MDKICLTISLFLLLVGCSKNPESSNKITQSYHSISISGDGNFGPVSYGKIKYKTLVVQNQSSSTISVNPSLRNSNNFAIGLTLGCQELLPGKGCVVKVFFNSNFKTAGTYSDFLDFNDQSIELTASVLDVPSVSYLFSLNNESGNNIDLGTIN